MAKNPHGNWCYPGCFHEKVNALHNYDHPRVCFRDDDTANCDTSGQRGKISIAHSLPKNIIDLLGSRIKRAGKSRVYSLDIPRNTTLQSSYIRKGIYSVKTKTASTGLWACNYHDNVFAPIDKEPDITNPEVPLLLALRALVHDEWAKEHTRYVRASIASMDIHNRPEWSALAANAVMHKSLASKFKKQILHALISGNYDAVQHIQMQVGGKRILAATTVNFTRDDGFFVSTILPNKDSGHTAILCWNKDNKIIPQILGIANYVPEQFLSGILFQNHTNLYISPSAWDNWPNSVKKTMLQTIHRWDESWLTSTFKQQLEAMSLGSAVNLFALNSKHDNEVASHNIHPMAYDVINITRKILSEEALPTTEKALQEYPSVHDSVPSSVTRATHLFGEATRLYHETSRAPQEDLLDELEKLNEVARLCLDTRNHLEHPGLV